MTAEAKHRAVEAMAHNIAACVHMGLSTLRMTVSELKEQITDWDAELVDSILLGVQLDKIKCNHLADLAFILHFNLEMRITKLPGAEPAAAQSNAPAE